MMQQQTDEPLICVDNFNDYYDPRLKRANAEQMSQLDQVHLVEGDFCDVEFNRRLLAEYANRSHRSSRGLCGSAL